MAVANDPLKIDPYTSAVPLIQVPAESGQNTIQPAQPLRGQFGGGRGSGGLAIGDSILKGFMQGHAVKEQRKYAQATATMAALDKNVDAAYSQYQDALSGSKDAATIDAAYKNYVGQFQAAKQEKSKFVIPDKTAGKKSSSGSGGVKGKAEGFVGGIKEFMAANPHIVPQIALMTMQPKPPGLSRETREQNAQTTAMENQAELSKKQLSGEDQRQQALKYEQDQKVKNDQKKAQQEAVEAAGGVDKVRNDPKADPEMKKAANEMYFSNMDAQSPEVKLKTQIMQTVADGKMDTLSAGQHYLAEQWGMVKPAQPHEIERGGKKYLVNLDPNTNQPIKGTEVYVGPSAASNAMAGFYAQRAATKSDIAKAVKADPAANGVILTGNPQVDKDRISAAVDVKFAETVDGLNKVSRSTGKTATQVFEDNAVLSDLVGSVDGFWKGIKDKTQPVSLDWEGGKVDATKDQLGAIYNQFFTSPQETLGGRSFRDSVNIPEGKPLDAVERDRLTMLKFLRDRLQVKKIDGKELTPAQADNWISNHAPILLRSVAPSSASGRMTAPPQSPQSTPKNMGPDSSAYSNEVTMDDLRNQQ